MQSKVSLTLVSVGLLLEPAPQEVLLLLLLLSRVPPLSSSREHREGEEVVWLQLQMQFEELSVEGGEAVEVYRFGKTQERQLEHSPCAFAR